MLSIIIPVFNEQNTIAQVLKKVLDLPIEKEIIVVDDGSTDKTSKIADEFKCANLKIIKKDKNSGKGAAVREGIDVAKGDIIAIQDADLEYDPNDFLLMLKPFEDPEVGAAFGNRFPNGKNNMFLRQYIANKFITYFVNILFFSNIKDIETCYKLIRSDIIKNIDLHEDNFDIEPEIAIKLIKSKVKIRNVDISYTGRGYDAGKKIAFKDALSALAVILKYKFFS